MSEMKIKTLAFSALLLAGCSSGEMGGVASASSFVNLASLSQLHVTSCCLRSDVGLNGSTTTSSSGSTSIGAHETDFYSNDDFSFTVSSGTTIGHKQNGFYYLLNGTKSSGFQFLVDTPLESYRAYAKELLTDDYTYLSSLYSLIQSYATSSDISTLGLSSAETTYGIAGDTIGYTTKTIATTDTSKTELDYYMTLDKEESYGYAFTDVIVRQATTDLSTGNISYTNKEYSLTYADNYDDTNFVFNLASYTIALGNSDISAIDPNALVGR